MKITSHILSIPPYLSTQWKNIESLHMRPVGNLFTLVVLLNSQTQVEIPGLNKETIEEIFEAHARSTEALPTNKNPSQGPFSFGVSFDGAKDGGLADFDFRNSLEHNPSQKDLPDIPDEIIKKIKLITKALNLEDFSTFSNPHFFVIFITLGFSDHICRA